VPKAAVKEDDYLAPGENHIGGSDEPWAWRARAVIQSGNSTQDDDDALRISRGER
jgi:hypothetical protein